MISTWTLFFLLLQRPITIPNFQTLADCEKAAQQIEEAVITWAKPRWVCISTGPAVWR